MNEVRIDFDEVRKEVENYDLYCYVCDIFEDMQDIANLDGGSIKEQLDYANRCGSYSCNTLVTVDRLNKIYFSICEFIKEYEENYGENLSKLYFENIEAFEICIVYYLYEKFMNKYFD